MEYYQIWLIAAIILVIVELCTAGFGSICFAIGALGSALAAYFGANLLWQLGIFAAISLVTFIFLRPVLIKLLDRKNKDVKTNADALIGRIAIVSETIDPANNTGRVAVDGDDWKAVSENQQVIEKGTKVEIVGRESIIVTVKVNS